jgi:CHAD domain-containing protein
MSRGKEMMKKLQDALGAFEDAVVAREARHIGSKVALQQEVDKAREAVVDVVVALVRSED